MCCGSERNRDREGVRGQASGDMIALSGLSSSPNANVWELDNPSFLVYNYL